MSARTLEIDFQGETLVIDGRRAVFWPRRQLLIVADLHLQKAASFAPSGTFLPPYDTRATLARLVALMNDHRPEQVVSLGDGFHRRDSYQGLGGDDLAQLQALARVCTWTWVHGNHDPDAPADHGVAGGSVLELAPLRLTHHPGAGPVAGEIAGHLHPKASVRVRGRRVSSACFVLDGHRLLLPAFGEFTGGLDVWDPAIAGLYPGGFTALLAGRDGGLRALPSGRLEGARRRAS